MAYNHYTAICNPLLYPAIMSHSVCILLVASSYVLGLLHSSVHMDFTFSLPFCRPAEVNHFYCNLMPVLALSCSVSTSTRVSLAGLVEMVTILAILVSYAFILSAVSKISSAKGQHKTFSTCTSHLAGVAIFQGSIVT
ncbi:PREDICTED: olfactory receptor 5T3-like [Fulmarus glacialis]|uniref:olfactory receptor 5T3-like n=1 Tax=Fulmarus glacialis TaxID=30455 RepID=UPI00051B4688|nr:PREDICTED: olfactory receptor 5T3-like [Fulmarus glacialis]